MTVIIFMSEPTLSAAAVRRIEQRYEQLKNQLLELGWISQRSLIVSYLMPGVGLIRSKLRSSRWLSPKQAELYQKAITNHRKLEKLLRQMRKMR